MIGVTERWRTERVMAAMYDAGVKHDRVAMVGAWTMWGADMRRMFADVARLADTPAGISVLDIPCGGGFAFRVLRPGQPVRYVAADILCVTYNGLHCLPDPRAALAELTRVLRPGGTLRGTSCVTGRGPRKDALIAVLRRAGVFGNAPRAGEIERWLREFGFDVVTIEHSGAVEFFEAQLPFGGGAD